MGAAGLPPVEQQPPSSVPGPTPGSIVHDSVQPSPATLLPSSHCSVPSTVPLPQPGVMLVRAMTQKSSMVQPPYCRPWSLDSANLIWTEPLAVREGHVTPPDGPGLGLTLDEARVAAHRVDA